MKAEQVDKALAKKFRDDNARLVFWHDADAEFAEYVQQGLADELDGIKVLDVAEVGGFSAKLLLEREDPERKYLVYSRGEEPPAQEDWLYDIRLYSAEFHADLASIWRQELGLERMDLREHLKAREAFMASRKRREKLARITDARDDKETLDYKMLAVVVGAPEASAFSILGALCQGHFDMSFDDSARFDLNMPPDVLETLEKMSLSDAFWALMHRDFRYESDSPTLAGLLRQLFASELLNQLGDEQIKALEHFGLPDAGARNAAVYLTQWRDSNTRGACYDAAARAVSEELKIKEHVADLPLGVLKNIYTFWAVERRVASRLKELVRADINTVDVELVEAVAGERQVGHWLMRSGDDPARRAMSQAYDAIVAAAQLFALHVKYRNALQFDAPEDLLGAYRRELYQFDALYRRFCTAAKPAVGQGWNLLKDLAGDVERVYDHGFLQPLGIEWSRLLDDGFLETWSLPEVPSQYKFYDTYIRKHLKQSERKRAFVIISDAFRYEAAKELTQAINGRYRMNAKLDAMLGVLPSYTGLGMASLLPHKTLEYNEKGEVLVDGKSSSGAQARNVQLAAVKGMACKAQELLPMKTDDAREFTDGARVVYIYHNIIDARGDSASTESEAFDAVSDCIEELGKLIKFCVNSLNAAKVWVTADHGFLYQQEAPDLTDKSKLSHKPAGAVIAKKRYIIGRALGTSPEAHHGRIEDTAGAEGDMEFWIPRGANRFHFTGGARFFHGGAMPQEVVVPVITVTQLRGEKKDQSAVRKVAVQVLGGPHKITAPSYRFELIQTEAVSERRHPITLQAAVYDEGQAVTSIETITFDSSSDIISERTKSLRLTLRSGTYDKSKPYRLVLRDAETDAEVRSIDVVIDRSFDDDF